MHKIINTVYGFMGIKSYEDWFSGAFYINDVPWHQGPPNRASLIFYFEAPGTPNEITFVEGLEIYK